MRQGSLRQQDSSPHIDIKHGIVILNAELSQTLDALEAGVVDEDVNLDAAPAATQALGLSPLDGLADKMSRALEAAQVGLDGVCFGVVRQRLYLPLQLDGFGAA